MSPDGQSIESHILLTLPIPLAMVVGGILTYTWLHALHCVMSCIGMTLERTGVTAG